MSTNRKHQLRAARRSAITGIPSALIEGAFLFTLCVESFAGVSAPAPYGVCSHLTWGEFSGRDKTFALCRVAGMGTVRCDFPWNMVEKPKGTWDFSRTDAIMADAKAAGIAILPILHWDRNDYPKPFADPGPWSDYIRHVAERYAADIPVFEIWNEPDLKGYDDVGNPTNYLVVLKSAYDAVKAVAPGARVAIGGFGEADGKHTPLGFIEEFYKLGGGAYFDIMNIHPYSVPYGPEEYLIPNLENLRSLMAKYGDAGKPVWITEIGWPTNEQKPGFDPKKGDKWHYMGGVSEAESALFLSRALGIAFAEGVETFMPYELRDREFEQYNNEAHYGLCRNNFTPKPAFAAYATFTAMRPAGSVQKSDRPWRDGGFFFPQWRRPDTADAKREGAPLGADAGMLWTTDRTFRKDGVGDGRILHFTSEKMRFFDHLGAEVWPTPRDGGWEVVVTDKPVFFVGGQLKN